jgi:hypothetical protein
VLILNWSPTQSVEDKTSYEVWYREKHVIHYLQTFGYVAHIKQGRKQLSKLKDHRIMVVFIGYEVGSKAWKFYNLATRRVHVSHDIMFKEDHG